MSFLIQTEQYTNNKMRKGFRTERSPDVLQIIDTSINQKTVPIIQRTCRSRLPEQLKGSLTIEAAIALPIVIMAIWLLVLPLKVMESERIIQNRLETTAHALSFSGYLRETGEKNLKHVEKYADIIDSVHELAGEGVALESVLSMPEAKMMDMMRFGPGTTVLSDSAGHDPDMIHIELEYELALPSKMFRILPVHKSLVVHRRAWTGSEGGRGRETYGGQSGETGAEDPIVYVGKNSTRYHKDPHCHYLSNKMKTAGATEIQNFRNAGGARYHACPACKPGTSGTVWYFESGTAYHSTENCKAITAYARAVPLSEVAYLGPCTYCSKK